VVAILQRKNGAALAEITKATDRQQCTVLGFIAGIMKKAFRATDDAHPGYDLAS